MAVEKMSNYLLFRDDLKLSNPWSAGVLIRQALKIRDMVAIGKVDAQYLKARLSPVKNTLRYKTTIKNNTMSTTKYSILKV